MNGLKLRRTHTKYIVSHTRSVFPINVRTNNDSHFQFYLTIGHYCIQYSTKTVKNVQYSTVLYEVQNTSLGTFSFRRQYRTVRVLYSSQYSTVLSVLSAVHDRKL